MRVETNKKSFKEIKLTVILETLDEVTAFYAIFNHSRITRNMDLVSGSTAIRGAIKSLGFNYLGYANKYHDRLCEIVRG